MGRTDAEAANPSLVRLIVGAPEYCRTDRRQDGPPLRACGHVRGMVSSLVEHPMHLRLTEEQLATLLEMISLAAEVASLNRKPGAETKYRAYEEFENSILEKAKLKGFSDIIQFDEQAQRHRISMEYLTKSFVQECLDEMRNEIFWEELTLRLAERDIIKQIGLPAWSALSDEQQRARTEPIERRYWEEFTAKGIDNLHIVARFGAG